MIDLNKKPRRQTPFRDLASPPDHDVLPWQAWAAFCDFYEGVQAVYAQIGYTSGYEPALDNLWNFFLNVIHGSHHYTRGKSNDRPTWKSLEEWCREAEVTQN